MWSLARRCQMNESSIRVIRNNGGTIRHSVKERAPIVTKTHFITRYFTVEKTGKARIIWIEDQTQK